MYCATCDRWEDDQIALDCESVFDVEATFCQPDDSDEDEENDDDLSSM